MKKYLRKTLLIVLIIILLLSVKKYATPYYLGDVMYGTKLKQFQQKQHITTFNTVFFGASVTKNHINTTLFDSLLQDKNIKSFNFGTSMAFNPESFFLYENFLKTHKNDNITYAFMGLFPLRKIEDKHLNTTKYSYCLNFHTLYHAIRYIDASNYTKKKKIELTKNYIHSFVYSYLDFKIFENYTKINEQTETKSTDVNGFLALDNEILKGSKKHKAFLSDTLILRKRREAAIYFNNSTSDGNLNNYYLNYLKSLIKYSEEKNITLIFILHPRLEENYYKEMIPIANALPRKNLINLSDPSRYEELYKVKFSFDADHLNNKGAGFYTNYLVNEFRRKIN